MYYIRKLPEVTTGVNVNQDGRVTDWKHIIYDLEKGSLSRNVVENVRKHLTTTVKEEKKKIIFPESIVKHIFVVQTIND